MKFWNDILSKKVLVTGGCGFIGSHLVEKLIHENYQVTIFDKYNSFNNLGWFNDHNLSKEIIFNLADIRDYDAVEKSIKDKDIVIHLAALIGIPYSYYSPLAYINTNIVGTYNVLESCKKLNTKQLIVTSTSEVYGSALYTPIDEKHPIQAQSPYSASKSSADNLAISYHKSFSLPVKIIRPFNTYGPRQSLRAVIPTIISQTIDPHTDKIKVGDISTTRDFNYVKDMCEAFIELINHDSYGEVYNVGSSKNISIENLIKKIFEITKIEKEIILEDKRLRPKNSEVLELISDFKKFNSLTNWQPKYNFEKGLNETIDWYRDNKHLHASELNNYIV